MGARACNPMLKTYMHCLRHQISVGSLLGSAARSNVRGFGAVLSVGQRPSRDVDLLVPVPNHPGSLFSQIPDKVKVRNRIRRPGSLRSSPIILCVIYAPAMPPVPTVVRSRIKLDTRHAAAPLPMRRSLFRSRDMACRSANAGAIVFGHRRFNPPARNPHVHGARPARGGVYQQPQNGH